MVSTCKKINVKKKRLFILVLLAHDIGVKGNAPDTLNNEQELDVSVVWIELILNHS